MQLQFNIHYRTSWGQQVAVKTNLKGQEEFRLQYAEDGHWAGTVDCEKVPSVLEYQYCILNDHGGLVQQEFGASRTHRLPKVQSMAFYDNWRSAFEPENALRASAFEEVIFNPSNSIKAPTVRKKEGMIRVHFALPNVRVLPTQQLRIVGNLPGLGEWSAENALVLGNDDYPIWRGSVLAYPWQAIEYKYLLVDTTNNQTVWEKGENRVLDLPDAQEVVWRTDESFRHPRGLWKGAGVAMPVFSLRTKKSLGTGEFTDIKALVDWAERVGMRMVQILPVNDTTATKTWVDSYPYAAISVFALHPLFLNVEALEKTINKATLTKKRKALNAQPEVDYEAVMEFKLAYARKVFDKVQ